MVQLNLYFSRQATLIRVLVTGIKKKNLRNASSLLLLRNASQSVELNILKLDDGESKTIKAS